MLISCFILFSGIFETIPSPLVLNLSRKKHILLVFLTYEESRDSKIGKVRCHVSELNRRTKRAKVGHLEIKGMGTRPSGAPTLLGRATWASFQLQPHILPCASASVEPSCGCHALRHAPRHKAHAIAWRGACRAPDATLGHPFRL
jgi:hypothetical protein